MSADTQFDSSLAQSRDAISLQAGPAKADFKLSQSERTVLRRLAREVAALAALRI